MIRYAVEAMMVSTALAGVKKVHGLSTLHLTPGPATEIIENSTLRLAVDTYLDAGDWILDSMASFMSRYPAYFRKKK